MDNHHRIQKTGEIFMKKYGKFEKYDIIFQCVLDILSQSASLIREI